MKKLLFLLTILLGAVSAQALPFVPTSSPASPTTYWYFLKISGYYVGAASNENVTILNSVSASNDNHLWCFVGNEESGYKLFNKGMNRYLLLGTFLPDEPTTDDYVYYEAADGNTFYLYYNFNYFGYGKIYLYMATYGDQYGTVRDIDASPDIKGIFSVEQAVEGQPQPADPEWTTFDSDGVGYGYIDGGTGTKSSESSNNLVDNNADTKFYGFYKNCWVAFKASRDVEVSTYTIVTANDSRQQYSRALRSWKLEGSNDYYSWELIDVRNDYPMPFENKHEVTFNVNNANHKKYRYFKLSTTDYVLSADGVQISEVYINGKQHNWGSWETSIDPGCGMPGQKVRACSTCHTLQTEIIDATENHNFVDGMCSVCHLRQNEKLVLYNGQRVPYYIMGNHGAKVNDVWPEPPVGWATTSPVNRFDWSEMAMPIASIGHSDGPFTKCCYNSTWYGEYNCFFFRRPFVLEEDVKPNDTFTLRCIHDDNLVIYVNGTEVINEEGWTTASDDWTWENTSQSFSIPASLFHKGENFVSVYIQQNWGGAYFDFDLIMGKSNSTKGDVNGDGIVSGADVTALYNYLLDDKAVNGDADVNGDGIVSGSDVTALYNILLN